MVAAKIGFPTLPMNSHQMIMWSIEKSFVFVTEKLILLAQRNQENYLYEVSSDSRQFPNNS
jgi:hypothetical protein